MNQEQITQPIVASDFSKGERNALRNLEKEAHRLSKTIDRDRSRLSKAEKKLAKDQSHGKTGKRIQKDEAMIREAERELNYDLAKQEQIEAKIDALSVSNQYIAPTLRAPIQSNVLHHRENYTHTNLNTNTNSQVLTGSNINDFASEKTITTTTTTNTNTTGDFINNQNMHSSHDGSYHHDRQLDSRDYNTGAYSEVSKSTLANSDSNGMYNNNVGSGFQLSNGKVVEVVEHVHPVQVEEKVIREQGSVIREQVIEREIIPEERVEVHRHIHPVESVNIHELHKRAEVEVVKESVHQVHVKEVHEHVYPETAIEVEREVVHPERVEVVNRVIDEGEVKRKVVDLEMTNTVDKHHHHHHHHSRKHKHTSVGSERLINPTS